MPIAPAMKVQALVDDLGGRAEVARILGVNRSQVTRWLDERQSPDPENVRKVEAVELAMARLLRIYDPPTARAFLEGTNAALGNRRPMDLLSRGRVREVLDLIDSEEAGSFA
jgi:uncharacterized protein (DUF2384 family)